MFLNEELNDFTNLPQDKHEMNKKTQPNLKLVVRERVFFEVICSP